VEVDAGETERRAESWSPIAIYEAWARARHTGAKRANIPDGKLDELEPEGPFADPEQTASDNELRVLIAAAIDALPEEYRVVLVLRRIEGFSTAEVAGCLELPHSTLKSRLHRAEVLLRNELLEVARPPGSPPFL